MFSVILGQSPGHGGRALRRRRVVRDSGADRRRRRTRDPPTVVPGQTGDVSVRIVEGADVNLDCRGIVFFALNSKRGSALIAELPPNPR